MVNNSISASQLSGQLSRLNLSSNTSVLVKNKTSTSAKEKREPIQKELIKNRGQNCSQRGNEYEKKVYNILIHVTLNDKMFNTQKQNEIGGSSARYDLSCNYKDFKDINLEIKKHNTPDWMQCKLNYNEENNYWFVPEETGKLKKETKQIFNNIIGYKQLFNGEKPIFLNKKLTYNKWVEIKKQNNIWKDVYFSIPNDTIKKLYSTHGCQYIQVKNYGLYHLGNDICNFNVPEFIIDQQIRVRIKVHTTKNRNGYCSLSVVAACQPINIKNLQKSDFSLDNIEKLPKNLMYIL